MDRKTAITAVEMMDYFVEVEADSTALKQGATRLSYREFGERASRLAASMQAAGISTGDRVAVLSLNRIEQLIILYAAMHIGAVYVPLNFRLAPPELEYILKDARARAIFVEQEPFQEMVDILQGLDELAIRVLIDGPSTNGWHSWEDFQRSASVVVSRSPPQASTVVYQMYTSGTTGFPKGVLVTQQQLANFVVHAMLIPPRLPAGACHLTVAPLFHGAALCSAVVVLCTGRSLYILRQFNPAQFVDTLVREKIADTTVVPAMLHAILHGVPDLETYDFSHLQKITYGASPITAELLKQSMSIFGCNFQQGFGMTEMVASATSLTAKDHLKALDGNPGLLRSCGRAGPFTEIRIVDPESRETLPIGEVGEIAIRAPHMMEAYSGQPEKTREVISNGWYYSGDGGCMDAEGYVYIKDRIKDMIVTGGENVYPAEVENVLASHPALADVAVIGLPDEKYGSAVIAVCVLKSAGERPNTESLINFCRPLIAGYKIPRRYEFTDTLPRSASGKVLKNELRARFSK